MYSVKGNYKLIKWEFIRHEGIDRYSMKIVYFWCSTNNKSETVMSLSESAVENHGLLSRVRRDQELENVCASSTRSKEKKFYSE